MKRLLLILILTLSLHSWTKADDIRDFQIEGMSIGDSALDYFSENEIKNNLVTYYKDNKMSTTEIDSSKFKTYKYIRVSYQTKDKNYKINHIAGSVKIQYENCKKKMNEISNEFKKIFKNFKIRKETNKLPYDKSGKSIAESIYFDFTDGSLAGIQCYDMSKKSGYKDELKIQLVKKEMVDWLWKKAYK